MTNTTNSKIICLIDNIAKYSYDIAELSDQYNSDPKNKEVESSIKSIMENIMESCTEIDTSIASSTLQPNSIMVKISNYHVSEMINIMNCINKMNPKLVVRFFTHYFNLFSALSGFKTVNEPIIRMCDFRSLDVDINVTDVGVSITPTTKLDLEYGRGYKLIIKTNFNICGFTKDFYSFYFTVHNDTNMNSLWLMYKADILNRVSLYTRNVIIKGRMTKEKYQLIKMSIKLEEEISLMYTEVEQ